MTEQTAPLPADDALNWTGHARATLKLGLPLIGAQLAQQVVSVTDTVMLGWLGVEPLAAGVLGGTFWFLGFIIATGFAQAVMPMAASAEGAGDIAGVRRSVRMGLWVVTLFIALLMPLFWYSSPLLKMLGQEPVLADLAQDYLRIAQWALLPGAGVLVLRSYVSALERTAIVLWVMVLAAILNALLNWMLIFGNWGAPMMGIRGAATATLISTILALTVLVAYARFVPDLAKYALFVRFFKPDWGAFRDVLRIGVPVSATLVAEFGLFGMSSVMMGWLGTVQLAAHGVALQIISVLFMIPIGLMSAGTIRVGRAHGRGDPTGLGRAAATVLAMGLGFAVLSGVLLLSVPEFLIGLFLDESDPAAGAILGVGVSLLAVAAIFQVVDTLQVISAGLLRGIKDTKVPMFIAMISYWVIGIPIAYVMAFWLEFGGLGVWGGLATGLLCAAGMLTVRFARRGKLGLV